MCTRETDLLFYFLFNSFLWDNSHTIWFLGYSQSYAVIITMQLLSFLKKKFKYLFIWLHQVLAVVHVIFSWGFKSLNCGMWNLIPRLGIEPGPSALEAWPLSHWTTRKLPQCNFRTLSSPSKETLPVNNQINLFFNCLQCSLGFKLWVG